MSATFSTSTFRSAVVRPESLLPLPRLRNSQSHAVNDQHTHTHLSVSIPPPFSFSIVPERWQMQYRVGRKKINDTQHHVRLITPVQVDICGSPAVRNGTGTIRRKHSSLYAPPIFLLFKPTEREKRVHRSLFTTNHYYALLLLLLFLLTTVNLRDLQSSFESSVVCRNSTQKRAGKLMARSSQTGKRQERETQRKVELKGNGRLVSI